VKRAVAPFAGVDRDGDGHALALRLSDGTALAADLFVDCTPEAPLMNASARVDWSTSLPCDRLLVARAPALANPPAMLRTTAARAGWRWRMPLAHETWVGYTYASAFITDDEARAELAAAEPLASAPLALAQFSSGRRSNLWDRNCVAIGPAAVQLEPLVGADLHAAQVGVSTLIELFPRDARGDAERIEYHRLMVEHLDSLRDFTLAHYIAGPARPGAFWGSRSRRASAGKTGAQARSLPCQRAHRAAGFRIVRGDRLGLVAVGHGCKPDALELSVVLHLEKFGSREAAPLRAQVRNLAESMPPHREYVRRLGELAARAPR
jgi:tryptophan halogenase